MILTLTPNPSLDLLFTAETLVWDDANRMDAPRRRPGGQGINLARAARALGGDVLALAPLGGATGREIEAALRAEGTRLRAVPIQGETRVFVGVRETESGRSLLLNPRGPRLSPEEEIALVQAVEEAIEEHRPAWLACCGSIAPGLGIELYARLGRMAREAGTRFVADCDGEPLGHAVPLCDLLVPNAHEAGRLLGRAVASVPDAGKAATALRSFGVRHAVVTLGAEGAVAADDDGVWHAALPPIDSGSAVGAGDALLAAFLIAIENGAATPEALASGVAAGSAVLLGDGVELLRAEDVARLAADVVVRRI